VRRLHWRFATYYGLLALAALLLLGAATVVALAWEERAVAARRGAVEASLLAEAAAPVLASLAAGEAGARADLRRLAARAAGHTGGRVTIIAPDGRVLADTEADPDTMENHGTRPEVVAALQHERGTGVRFSTTVGRTLLYAAAVARIPGSATGARDREAGGALVGVVRVATSPPSVVAAHAPVLTAVAAVGTLIGAVSVVLAALIARAATEPLRRLTRAAALLAGGDLEQRVPVDRSDEVGELAAAFNEMAARLRADVAALTGERNQATAVLANMADGIVIVDRHLRVARVNPAAARLLALGPGEASGRSLAEVVRDYEVQQVLRDALAAGAPRTAVVRLTPPPLAAARAAPAAGAPRYVRATGIAIPSGAPGAAGVPAGLLVLQDVSEVRRAELVRREFVANVSHELRTPLASLKALVETLEEGALDDPPAARDFLALMHVEVDSLAHLVQELLELSRIESGQAALRLEAVPAAGLAEEAAGRLRMQAERAGIALTLEVPPDLPPVWADPARITQVLINLLHNALKFTPAGGQVALRATRDGAGVRFAVADTGMGIAPADLPRLFERFYKVDRSRASGGTGLGLAIAKHLVQAHGGRIWAESPGEGSGATFCFTLPLAPAPPAAPAAPRSPDPHASGAPLIAP
jgi:two-component system phosphate regulon sensor histidine kinase PhoR